MGAFRKGDHNIFDKDSPWRDIAGDVLSTTLAYLGGAYLTFMADATSYGFTPSINTADTASMKPGITSIDAMGNFSLKVFGKDAAVATMFCPSITSSLIATTEGIGGPGPDGIIIFFGKDALPYSHIEKRAEKLLSQLHKEEEPMEQFPTIIAKNQEMYEAFLPIYGKSIKTLKDNLEILEAALRCKTSD